MSTERDIIIERLEQKLAARDKEIAQIQETLRESILIEMEKRFIDKIKLRESTIEDIRTKFERMEHRLIELNSAYDGVIKELLDQKSIINEIRPPRPIEDRRQKPETRQEVKPKEDPKSVEKQRPKTEYIIADNYIPREKRKPQQAIIEAQDKPIDTQARGNEQLNEQLRKPVIKKSEKIMEGVEISETLKRGK